MEEPCGTLRAGRSTDTESTGIQKSTETAMAEVMEELSTKLITGGSPDTEKSEESTETTTTQDMAEPCGTLRDGRSTDTESTGIQKSTETAMAEVMEKISRKLITGGSPDAEKSEESTETSTTQAEPASTEISESSEDTEQEEGFEFIENLKQHEFENQDMDGPSVIQISEISSETENKPHTVIPMGTQPEAKTDGALVPLNSKTGALVPLQYNSPLYYLRRILFFWSWSGSQAAQPHEHPATFEGKIDKIRTILLSTIPYIWWFYPGYHTVGIFSRSSQSDYEWLIKQLKSEPFQSTVSTVSPHYISNNGKQKFIDAISGCTFGILYHTKNRGRINIVDVTDSLYDEELKYMSERLGKEKVIVVADDLEDASNEEKTRILENQPRIGNLATDIFLFSADGKK